MSTADTFALAAAAIAFYAAMVSTGVAFIQFRQWMLSGPRLSISVMAETKIFGGTEEEEAGSYVATTVVNRGDAPTTITHLGVVERARFYDRLFRIERKTFLVPNPQRPGMPPNIPHVLQPGHSWTGLGARRADVPGLLDLLNSGRAHVLVQASHADKPTLKRIPKPGSVLKGAKPVWLSATCLTRPLSPLSPRPVSLRGTRRWGANCLILLYVSSPVPRVPPCPLQKLRQRRCTATDRHAVGVGANGLTRPYIFAGDRGDTGDIPSE